MDLHRYRVHDLTGDDLGLHEHPAPNVEEGDVVTLPDGREAPCFEGSLEDVFGRLLSDAGETSPDVVNQADAGTGQNSAFLGS